MPDSVNIGSALQNARSEIQSATPQAMLVEAEQRQRDEILQKLKIAIEHSLFLEDQRKKMWIAALHTLQLKQAEELLGAILRENLRFKKNIRKLKFKEIPERVSEENPH